MRRIEKRERALNILKFLILIREKEREKKNEKNEEGGDNKERERERGMRKKIIC